MELRTYLNILWRRKWIVVITPLIAMVVAIAGTFMMTPTYVATATLRITMRDGSSDLFGNLMYGERLMNTYAAIIKSGPVLESLKQQLEIDEAPEVTVEFPANTELMEISVTTQDPLLAADAANTLAQILMNESRRTKVGRTHPISVVDPAVPPQNQDSPQTILILAFGIIVGVGGGLGLAFLFENLDTTLYSPNQIVATTELVILGQIPTVKNYQKVAFMNGQTAQGEAFRRLRTNIFVPNQEILWHSLLVTSAEPGEGKSTITANLALTTAQSGRSVLVIDSDLRLPTLHQIFGLSNQIGLSNVLKQEVPLAEAIQPSDIPGVQVLTSGLPTTKPAELLGSPQMAALIEQAKQQFDFVLLDTPALLAVADAAILAPVVDGVIVVIKLSATRQEAVTAACEQLATVKATPVGIVVNRAKQNDAYTYYQPNASSLNIK